MAEHYGEMFTDRAGVQVDSKGLWAYALRDVSPQAQRLGFARLVDLGEDFPPRPGRFAAMCKDAMRQHRLRTDAQQIRLPKITDPGWTYARAVYAWRVASDAFDASQLGGAGLPGPEPKPPSELSDDEARAARESAYATAVAPAPPETIGMSAAEALEAVLPMQQQAFAELRRIYDEERAE